MLAVQSSIFYVLRDSTGDMTANLFDV